MDILEISKHLPDLNVTVKAGALLEMVQLCIQETYKRLEQLVTDAKTETYLNRTQAAKMLSRSKVTLWRWGNENYLIPIKIGGKICYRLSDINRLLGEGRCKGK
jgi:hypothetical protein